MNAARSNYLRGVFFEYIYACVFIPEDTQRKRERKRVGLSVVGKELVDPIYLVTLGSGLVKSGVSHSPNPG